MFKKLTRVAVAGAALAASMAALATTSSTAFAAGPPGTLTLSPLSGVSTGTFSLAVPAGAACTNSGGNNPSYKWQTYMISSAVDASTLKYLATGPSLNAAGTYASPLYDSLGNPVVNVGAQSTPLGAVTGIPSLSFDVNANNAGANGVAVTAGSYKLGIICTTGGNIDASNYWETLITVSNVTATSFNYQFGAAPAAPVLSALTPGNGTLAGSFTAAPSTPAQTGYTVTAVPTSGPTVTLPVAAPGAFTLTGLTNGTAYTVTASATNTVGTTPSNSVVGTPAVTVPAPSPFTATSQTGQVTLNWTPATVPSGYTLVNHIVTVSPSVAGSPFTVAAGTNTLVVPAAVGTYTFTIKATYNPGTGVTAGTATTTGDSLNAQVLIQDLTVTRPVGALVLTQRCGVNGALPAVAVDSATGFGALALLPASTDQTGTAPGTPNATSPGDSQFGQYPYPVDPNGVASAVYPTHCGVNLGIGKLITSGPRAGQYFTATGFINEVTVVDTRDTDPGFTINGTASTFTNGSSTFSGNYLGWQPVVNSTSGATLAGYDQTLTAGPILQPSLASGLATAQPLASAIAGQGLGIATLDARLKLLIPLTARNGGFTATLTFTTA